MIRNPIWWTNNINNYEFEQISHEYNTFMNLRAVLSERLHEFHVMPCTYDLLTLTQFKDKINLFIMWSDIHCNHCQLIRRKLTKKKYMNNCRFEQKPHQYNDYAFSHGKSKYFLNEWEVSLRWNKYIWTRKCLLGRTHSIHSANLVIPFIIHFFQESVDINTRKSTFSPL